MNLTSTEAETLAVMLTSASRKMARVRDRIPGTGQYGYVWDLNTEDAMRDMFEGFYEIFPVAEYGITIQ